MIRKIVTTSPPDFQSEVLRKRCKSVRNVRDVKDLAKDLTETLEATSGVGLAAPQIGEHWRVIAVRNVYKEGAPIEIYVNPRIVYGKGKVIDEEGCLSIPGYVASVERFEVVEVVAQNLQGRRIRVKAKGFWARIFQHEIDHLEGILYVDRMLPDTFREAAVEEEEK